MLNEHTLDQLRSLRLDGMVRAIEEQATSTAAASPFYLHIAILMIGFSVKLKRSGESGCLIW